MMQPIDMGIPSDPPEVRPLSYYLTVQGLTSLIVDPFLQGFFYGLGEGLSYWGLARWFRMDFGTVSTQRGPRTRAARSSVPV